DMLAGKYARVVSLGLEMVERALPLEDSRALCHARCVVALGAMCSGNATLARTHFEAARTMADKAVDRSLQAMVLENFGAAEYQFGDLQSARGLLETALGLHEESTSQLKSALARQLLSRVSLAEGDTDQALNLAHLAVASVRTGNDRWLGKCLTTLAA